MSSSFAFILGFCVCFAVSQFLMTKFIYLKLLSGVRDYYEQYPAFNSEEVIGSYLHRISWRTVVAMLCVVLLRAIFGSSEWLTIGCIVAVALGIIVELSSKLHFVRFKEIGPYKTNSAIFTDIAHGTEYSLPLDDAGSWTKLDSDGCYVVFRSIGIIALKRINIVDYNKSETMEKLWR